MLCKTFLKNRMDCLTIPRRFKRSQGEFERKIGRCQRRIQRDMHDVLPAHVLIAIGFQDFAQIGFVGFDAKSEGDRLIRRHFVNGALQNTGFETTQQFSGHFAGTKIRMHAHIAERLPAAGAQHKNRHTDDAVIRQRHNEIFVGAEMRCRRHVLQTRGIGGTGFARVLVNRVQQGNQRRKIGRAKEAISRCHRIHSQSAKKVRNFGDVFRSSTHAHDNALHVIGCTYSANFPQRADLSLK
jgi:hypothetical protein